MQFVSGKVAQDLTFGKAEKDDKGAVVPSATNLRPSPQADFAIILPYPFLSTTFCGFLRLFYSFFQGQPLKQLIM